MKLANKETFKEYGIRFNKDACEKINTLIRDGKCYPCEHRGSGNYGRYVDHSGAIVTYCKDAGIVIRRGNDAPRGGRTGEYFEIVK